MKILVINAGSSSMKYQLINMEENKLMAKGICEQIGCDNSEFTHTVPGAPEKSFKHVPKTMENHRDALKMIVEALTDESHGVIQSMSEISAVGHRVLHGAEKFCDSVIIDDAVIAAIKECIPLGPLHNPANLTGIEACRKLMPGVPQVAVFDTGFHQTMPDYAYMYALPYEYYEKYGIRRYGFHGTSHRYVSQRAAVMLGKDPSELKIVTCHLGNGSSITAVDGGKCVDTSFGMSLQTGIPQTNRSGDIDPFLIFHMVQAEGMPLEEVQQQMQTNGGLLGISGVSGDLRDILEVAEENERARLAVEIYCREIARYIGGYAAIMGGLDAIAFTGGIGENSTVVRQKVLGRLAFLGVCQGKSAKKGEISCISSEESRVRAYVIPANEELGVARKTANLLKSI